MSDRSPARFVAPLALAGAALAVVLVVKSSRPHHSATSTAATTATTTVQTHRKHRIRHRYYVVKKGDLLSTIAQKYGLSTQVLEELNPKLDPQTLQAGQRVRLR